jgi:hypothetical protein
VTIRAVRSAAALAVLLVLAACARADGGSADPPATAPPYGPDDLVLQVAYTGGFVTPEMLAGRLPLLSVYGDGRVITEGPVAAIYPGPALPNLQVQQIDAADVQALVDRALDAGVGDPADLGTPGIADAAATRFRVSTGLETLTTEVYALAEAGEDDGLLTPDQAAARQEMRGLLDALTDLPGTLGADAVSASEPYVPTAVGALVTPYVPPDDAFLDQPDTAWPGPALPGEPLEPQLGLTCVVATGDAATAVLDAARSANSLTPWLSGDGARWSLMLRPLLPEESGCADLPGS